MGRGDSPLSSGATTKSIALVAITEKASKGKDYKAILFFYEQRSIELCNLLNISK